MRGLFIYPFTLYPGEKGKKRKARRGGEDGICFFTRFVLLYIHHFHARAGILIPRRASQAGRSDPPGG
jgi:hypothetical protein